MYLIVGTNVYLLQKSSWCSVNSVTRLKSPNCPCMINHIKDSFINPFLWWCSTDELKRTRHFQTPWIGFVWIQQKNTSTYGGAIMLAGALKDEPRFICPPTCFFPPSASSDSTCNSCCSRFLKRDLLVSCRSLPHNSIYLLLDF